MRLNKFDFEMWVGGEGDQGCRLPPILLAYVQVDSISTTPLCPLAQWL